MQAYIELAGGTKQNVSNLITVSGGVSSIDSYTDSN
jgi:hypothetical protein